MSYIEKILSVNERILFQSRQHIIVLISHIFKTLVLTTLLIGVGVAIIVLTRSPDATMHSLQPAGAIFLLLSLIPLVWCLGQWKRWSAEQYIVTSRRVIQVGGVFNKYDRDSSLDKINDILMAQTFFGRMLNYADIEIVTGNETGVNKLYKLDKPLDFKRALLEAKENHERDMSGANRPIAAPMPVPLPPPPPRAQDFNTLYPPRPERYDNSEQRRQQLADQPTATIPLQRSGSEGKMPQANVNIPEQIAQLARLRDQGVISDEEFQVKKREMLSRM